MKQFILLFTILMIFFSCSDRQPGEIKDSILIVDSTTEAESIVEDTFSHPSNFFLHIIHDFVIPSHFVSDTNRIKKVPYYFGSIQTSSIFMADNYPFYKMDTATNRVFNYLKFGTGNLHYTGQDSIRKAGKLYKILSKVNSITGFYFTENQVKDTRTDAFIEEWVFNTDVGAKKAEDELKNIYQFVYFNSFAHVFRRGNYLYTFYSRSTWAAKRLEKMYDGIINLD